MSLIYSTGLPVHLALNFYLVHVWFLQQVGYFLKGVSCLAEDPTQSTSW